MNKVFYQQGDVLIVPVEKLDSKLSRKDDNIVAEGEATGHMHEIIGEDAQVLVDKDGNIFVDAPNGCTITHQEHHNINLPKGTFKIGIVKEYDPLEEEIRNVRD